MSFTLSREKGLLPLAVGEGFPLQKLFSLFHLQDFPPLHASFHSYPFELPSAAPLSPWHRVATGVAVLQRRLRSSYKQLFNSPPYAKH